MAPSAARARYERLVTAADPVAEIRGMTNATPPTFEDDFFDCKVEPFDADVNKRKAALQKIWSEALTAFANSGGGVVVWGLVAKSDPVSKIDMVVGENLVSNLAQLANDLRRLQPEQSDPPLGGVQYTQIPVNGGPGGFLVCFIPEGQHKPCRQLSADRQYWYRAGDTSRVMPRHMLQAMFYPKLAPRFQVEVAWDWAPVDDILVPKPRNLAQVEVVVRLQNVGSASAKDVVVRIVEFDPARARAPQAAKGWQAEGSGFRCSYTIHPGMPDTGVFVCKWEEPTNGPNKPPSCIGRPQLRLGVFAENARPSFFKSEISLTSENSWGRKRSLIVVAEPEEEQTG
jgi:hypothetical protein